MQYTVHVCGNRQLGGRVQKSSLCSKMFVSMVLLIRCLESSRLTAVSCYFTAFNTFKNQITSHCRDWAGFLSLTRCDKKKLIQNDLKEATVCFICNRLANHFDPEKSDALRVCSKCYSRISFSIEIFLQRFSSTLFTLSCAKSLN